MEIKVRIFDCLLAITMLSSCAGIKLVAEAQETAPPTSASQNVDEKDSNNGKAELQVKNLNNIWFANNFPTLQAAIDATPSSAILVLPVGDYPVPKLPVTIGSPEKTKRLRIIGHGTDTNIVPPDDAEYVFEVDMSDAYGDRRFIMDGLDIFRAGGAKNLKGAINLKSVGNYRLQNLTLYGVANATDGVILKMKEETGYDDIQFSLVVRDSEFIGPASKVGVTSIEVTNSNVYISNCVFGFKAKVKNSISFPHKNIVFDKCQFIMGFASPVAVPSFLEIGGGNNITVRESEFYFYYFPTPQAGGDFNMLKIGTVGTTENVTIQNCLFRVVDNITTVTNAIYIDRYANNVTLIGNRLGGGIKNLCGKHANAKNVVEIGNSGSSAITDLNSTEKGFLPPRMTTAQRDAISNPAAGLMVYNTTTNKLNVFNGKTWEAVNSD